MRWFSLRLAFLAGIFLVLALVACREPRPAPPTSPPWLPATARLVALSFVDPRHGWVVAADCLDGNGPTGDCRSLTYSSDDGGRSWAPGGRALVFPRALQFADRSTGWLIGSIGQECGANPCPNVVMRSVDGGRSWERASTTSASLVDLSFVSATDGWALGEGCSARSACRAILITTRSGGMTWFSQELPLTGHHFVLDRLDSQRAWVAGVDQGQLQLLATTDGGAHWTSQTVPCRGDAPSLHFRTPTEGWLACLGDDSSGASAVVLHTTDEGQTWHELAPVAAPTAGAQLPSSRLFFLSPEDGWLVTPGGALLASHDGGRRWAAALDGSSPVGWAQFVDSQHGWALGRQTVWQTSDGGATWVVASGK